jgi:hypothetical protein
MAKKKKFMRRMRKGFGVLLGKARKAASNYNPDNSETLIYPNPTSSDLYWNKNIIFDGIIVYNSKGQVVLNVNKPESNSFSLINIDKGIYFIIFLKEKQRVLTKKIIKE